MNSSFFPSRRILLEAVVLVTVAAAVGLSLNYTMVMNAFSGRNVVNSPPVPIESAEVQFPQPVDYEELDGLLADGHLLIDARDRQIYADSHLPGAVAFPLGEVDSLLAEFVSRVSYETPLIIYCNGFGCPDSFDLGVRLLEEGYHLVQVYEGGFPEWRDRGRPLESGEAQ